ncbi:MAG: hypothetical protein GY791_18675 [Alphaproteobacteria bacterium]|nr:hypothetical protein [Alphaproteobacteria bacterium]
MGQEVIKEVIAHFADEPSFRAAVDALVESGVDRNDLSVLGSHDSLEITDAAKSPFSSWLSSLGGEVKYIGPLATAGMIAVATGPTGIFFAGLVAAAVGGYAAKELLDDLTSVEHAESFAHAFETGGVILWVRVSDEAQIAAAKEILAANGGDRIHLHERDAGKDA